MITLEIIVTIFLVMTVSSAVAQSNDDKTTVTQHRSGMMMQMSQPSKFKADSSMIHVLPSDSVNAQIKGLLRSGNIKDLKRLPEINALKKKELSYDPRKMVQQRMQAAMPEYTGPPVAIRTTAGKQNRVVVYVKNRTNKSLHDLSIQPDQLPDKWSSQPASRNIAVLPAGYQQTVAFSLHASSTQPRNVGFTLSDSNGLSIIWSARISLPKAQSKDKDVPASFELHGNYPNPFNPTTTISYSLPQDMHVRLTIYNVLGQRVVTLVNSDQQAGVQNITWDASRVASGTYIYRVIAKGQSGKRFVSERKMVLIK